MQFCIRPGVYQEGRGEMDNVACTVFAGDGAAWSAALREQHELACTISPF
jgi:hypothetical protein